MDKVRLRSFGMSMVHMLTVICVSVLCFVGMSSMSQVVAEDDYTVVTKSIPEDMPNEAEWIFYVDVLHNAQIEERGLRITVNWAGDPQDPAVVNPASYHDIINFSVGGSGHKISLMASSSVGYEVVNSSYAIPLDGWSDLGTEAQNHYLVSFVLEYNSQKEVQNMTLEVTKTANGLTVQKIDAQGQAVATTCTHDDGVTDTINFAFDNDTFVFDDYTLNDDYCIYIDSVLRGGSDVTDTYELLSINPLDTVVTCKKVFKIQGETIAEVNDLGLDPDIIVKCGLTSSASDETSLPSTIYVKFDPSFPSGGGSSGTSSVPSNHTLQVSLDGSNYEDLIVWHGHCISAKGFTNVGSHFVEVGFILSVTGCPVTTDAYTTAYTTFSPDNLITYTLQEVDYESSAFIFNKDEMQRVSGTVYALKYELVTDDIFAFTVDGKIITLEDIDIRTPIEGEGRKKYASRLQSVSVYRGGISENISGIDSSSGGKKNKITVYADKVVGKFRFCILEKHDGIDSEYYTAKEDCVVDFTIKLTDYGDVAYKFDKLPRILGLKIVKRSSESPSVSGGGHN